MRYVDCIDESQLSVVLLSMEVCWCDERSEDAWVIASVAVFPKSVYCSRTAWRRNLPSTSTRASSRSVMLIA